MKRTCYSLALMAAIVLPLGHAGGPEKDAKQLEGDWAPVSAEMAGKKMPDEFVKAISLNVKDGRYTVAVGKTKDEGTVSIDGTKKPKTMDLVGTDGPNKGKTILTIYEITGDTMKVCYDLGEKGRPTDFATKEGSLQFLVTYKRVTP